MSGQVFQGSTRIIGGGFRGLGNKWDQIVYVDTTQPKPYPNSEVNTFTSTRTRHKSGPKRQETLAITLYLGLAPNLARTTTLAPTHAANTGRNYRETRLRHFRMEEANSDPRATISQFVPRSSSLTITRRYMLPIFVQPDTAKTGRSWPKRRH